MNDACRKDCYAWPRQAPRSYWACPLPTLPWGNPKVENDAFQRKVESKRISLARRIRVLNTCGHSTVKGLLGKLFPLDKQDEEKYSGFYLAAGFEKTGTVFTLNQVVLSNPKFMNTGPKDPRNTPGLKKGEPPYDGFADETPRREGGEDATESSPTDARLDEKVIVNEQRSEKITNAPSQTAANTSEAYGNDDEILDDH